MDEAVIMAKAEQVLGWVLQAEREGGGIAAWREAGNWHRPYPEVTGYMIPTLFRWGEWNTALRCADWLVRIQRADGAFPALDGSEHTFDTAAALEGLKAAWRRAPRAEYAEAAKKALEWLAGQVRGNGTLRRMPEVDNTHFYTMRAAAIMQEESDFRADRAAKYWCNPVQWGPVFRPHYIAYGLEGLWRAGEYAFVRLQLERSRMALRESQFFPFRVNAGDWSAAETDTDVCATAQYGLLYAWAGMEYYDILERLCEMAGPNGLPHGTGSNINPAWAAKYFLDLVGYYEKDN